MARGFVRGVAATNRGECRCGSSQARRAGVPFPGGSGRAGRRWRVAMPQRPLSEQVDEAVQAMLVSLRPRPERDPSPSLAVLVPIAQVLRDLPRESFRIALKSDLQRRTSMNEAVAPSPERSLHYMRPGFTSITPYILVAGGTRFVEFLKAAFNGVERLRVPAPDGTIMHAEVAVGHGLIEL